MSTTAEKLPVIGQEKRAVDMEVWVRVDCTTAKVLKLHFTVLQSKPFLSSRYVRSFQQDLSWPSMLT